jgi:hypothetical protein
MPGNVVDRAGEGNDDNIMGEGGGGMGGGKSPEGNLSGVNNGCGRKKESRPLGEGQDCRTNGRGTSGPGTSRKEADWTTDLGALILIRRPRGEYLGAGSRGEGGGESRIKGG